MIVFDHYNAQGTWKWDDLRDKLVRVIVVPRDLECLEPKMVYLIDQDFKMYMVGEGASLEKYGRKKAKQVCQKKPTKKKSAKKALAGRTKPKKSTKISSANG